jgi:hypothetical protein
MGELGKYAQVLGVRIFACVCAGRVCACVLDMLGQVGIVSNGYGCARAGFPGAYTNVRLVLSWVSDTVGLGLAPLPVMPGTLDDSAHLPCLLHATHCAQMHGIRSHNHALFREGCIAQPGPRCVCDKWEVIHWSHAPLLSSDTPPLRAMHATD